MSTRTLYAVLLAGGSGTRFWPASRRRRPKQFLEITGARTMLAETAARLENLVPRERTLVVTTEEQLADVRASLPDLPEANLIAEPCSRNTAASVALAALEVQRRDANAVQVYLPADHVIRPREAFQRTVRAAVQAALDEASLLVFGIHPSHAATAYGWIKSGGVTDVVDGIAVHAVERFVEKPDAARARDFLAQGGYFWNSGMFVGSSVAIARALETHMADAYRALAKRTKGAELAKLYADLPPLSIDVAVLERARGVRMLPIDYFWSDVGSWDALATVHEPDAEHNVACGGAALVALDSARSIVCGERGGLVALIGVDDMIVVQAGQVTLVCRRDRAQDVKQLVERLQSEHPEFL